MQKVRVHYTYSSLRKHYILKSPESENKFPNWLVPTNFREETLHKTTIIQNDSELRTGYNSRLNMDITQLLK